MPRVRALFHSLDPGKPTVIVVDSNSGQQTLNQLALWKDASDVQTLDPYPCYVNQPCDFGWIDQVIAAADDAGLHYWGMVQAFSGGSWRWPTPAEESHMLGQWSVSAWTGLMTFAWSWSGDTLASSRPFSMCCAPSTKRPRRPDSASVGQAAVGNAMERRGVSLR